MPDRALPAALVPAAAARLGGLAVLVLVGALQWRRMVEGLGARPGAAVGGGGGARRRGARRRRPPAPPPGGRDGGRRRRRAARLPRRCRGSRSSCCKPARWDQLADGLVRGTEALGTVWLPYAGTDPWPGLTLQLLGAGLCALAGLLAFWPRETGRGYPFIALAGLLALVATPVVSLGGTQPLVLGGVLAAGTVCFLWLERLPLRPGLGVAALLGVAAAGAVPLAGVADREAAVVRLPGVRRGARARGSRPLRLDAGLRPDRLAADPRRGAARQGRRAGVLEAAHAGGVRRRGVARPPLRPAVREPAAGRPGARPPVRLGAAAGVDRGVRGVAAAPPGRRGARRGHDAARDRQHAAAADRGASRACGGGSRSSAGATPTPCAPTSRARRPAELATSTSGRQADELGLTVPLLDGGPRGCGPPPAASRCATARVRFRPFEPRGAGEEPGRHVPRGQPHGPGGGGAAGVALRAHLAARASGCGRGPPRRTST